uniref:Putative CelEx-BR12 n=1 Tax=uncultured bacterium fosmid pJB89E1 TaxID=1478073 RepID=A0A0H3U8B8_9BACT|nr:putative CelEx-BR12 [uncultured bacterium fosmid pJB89E1]
MQLNHTDNQNNTDMRNHRLTAWAFCLIASLGMMLTSCAQKEEQLEGFRIKRGTNLSHWLSQSMVRGEARANHIQEDDFARLHELGFDHVRIPIDEVQFWDEEGNKLPEAWDLLTNALDLARKYEIRAIVDLHVIRSHNFNAVNAGLTNSLFTDEAAQQRLIDMWYQLSDALNGYSTDWVAYEFMNEPVADEHEQWNQLIAKVHAALREREPNRTLVIGSNRWQGHETFKYLRVPEGDPNIILSFHYYNPMILTHRGAFWTPIGKYSGPISYPGKMITEENLAQAPADIQAELQQYVDMEWNRDVIYSQMKDAIEVAAKYGLQLFCGEWGVYEPVDRELAYAWTKDMISVFDEFNIAWTTWCYDADFGFWDQEKNDYKDKELVDIILNSKGLEK